LFSRLFQVNPTLTITSFAAGAAVVAFWFVVRFPGLGPRSVGRALVVAAAAFLVQTPLLGLTERVVSDLGVGATLLLVIFPSLTLLFWACGCLVRSLVSLAAPYGR
jgi:hypothetical protein